MDTRVRLAGLAVAAAGSLALAGGWAQPEPGTRPADAPRAAISDPKPRATVSELARAYLELEAAYFAAPVGRELCREVNIAFDDASKLFFAGDLARVVEIVDASAMKLREASKLPKPMPLDPAPVIEADFWSMAGGKPDEAPELPGRPLTIWNARRDLLASTSVMGSVESLVLGSATLYQELTAEAKTISKGENPYSGRRGDIWRPYFISDQPAPMRLFCPEHREPPAAGWPLVVALHGAGGNEHMFMAGYGVGRIKKLAEQHGFVVASPLNSPLAAQPAVFDALVDSVAADYPIDRSRIYLIGHSMGAGVALAWSKLRHEKVAATALIAGVGRFNEKDRLPPTLLIAPELDGLIPARSIIAAADQAKGYGLPVDCREIKDYGHTLVVGYVLPEVVDWLLQQPPAATAPSGQPNTQQPRENGDQP